MSRSFRDRLGLRTTRAGFVKPEVHPTAWKTNNAHRFGWIRVNALVRTLNPSEFDSTLSSPFVLLVIHYPICT